MHVILSQWHPSALAHCKTSRCPSRAATAHVLQSQGHP
eukprot:CAMPEP_0194314060 /NCGR_PEP_ID=MMETSP0171-20130528/10884_1 /TAXON_ID=218684 /ORGANISM="Corethron pennatum, Strain L29A3" /LENGTH=37 /DNA_ID= /DNA_START= /DNA_END= /DNA_ORIENTATION=